MEELAGGEGNGECMTAIFQYKRNESGMVYSRKVKQGRKNKNLKKDAYYSFH